MSEKINRAQGYTEVGFDELQGYGDPSEVEHQSILRKIEKKYSRAADIAYMMLCVILVCICAYAWISDARTLSNLSGTEFKVRIGINIAVTIFSTLVIAVVMTFDIQVLKFKKYVRKMGYKVVRCRVVDCDTEPDKSYPGKMIYNVKVMDMFRQCSKDTLEATEEVYEQWERDKNSLFALAKFGSGENSSYELYNID